LIAKERSLIHIHNSISLLNKIFLLLLICTLAFLFLNIFTTSVEKGGAVVPKNKKMTPPASGFEYEKIGEGPLAVDSELQSFPFPDLSGKILFLARSNRPDSEFIETLYLLGLKGSQEKRVVTPNQKLYLTYTEDHLIFSEKQTPLWIKPKQSGEGKTILQMGIDLVSSQGMVLLSETREHLIKEDWKPLTKEQVSHPELTAGIDAFEGAKWWPADRLFDQYAGDEYQIYRGLERLEILGEYVLFAEEGRTYVWKEGRWRAGNEEEYPLARVKEITPFKMIFELWDPTGIETVHLTFNRERARPIATRMEEVFTRLRQRTSSRVSCRIDNRATILKVGDWLFRTDRGWHTVKNSHEIDAIVKFKALGELFIFDGLESSDGKKIFCGSLFDPMRTELQSVRLPISQMKTLEHSPPTKKGRSTKIRPLASGETERSHSRLKSHQRLQPIEDYKVFEE